MNKLKCAILTATAVLSFGLPQTASAASASFTDVASDQYYAKAVEWTVQKGITSGTGKDTFSPEKPCTRAQIVSFLYRAYGKGEKSAESTFSDVNKDDYFYTAVNWATAHGITTGTGPDTFSPNSPCTRAQAVTFLYRAAGNGAYTDYASKFTDLSASQYFFPAVGWAVEKKIANGTTDSTFSPDNTCSRAQIVTFLYHAGTSADASKRPTLTMDKDTAYASVQANVKLNGSGTGYHAKVVIGSTATDSLASFGIQAESSPDYRIVHPNATGGVSFLLENIMYDAAQPGPEGKSYDFMGTPELNHTYKIRLSWTNDNRLHGYVDDQEYVNVHTTMAPPFIFAVEGSARMGGDSVVADFTDIRAKAGDNAKNWGLQGLWGEADEDFFGLHSTVTNPGKVSSGANAYNTHGKKALGASVHIEGTADVPEGIGPDGLPWNWDTTIWGLGHPISAIVNIGQYGQ